ncbi:MAG: DUF6178 family protein [Oligoflexia bacterium]|nr:DUF6178 family protein [Oligoflexia bacterium]
MSRRITPWKGSQRLLTRILEEPGWVASLQSLSAPGLVRLIQKVGLEDSGELIALATTEQLRAVFDEDLWRGSRPGEAEVFDGARFGLWLEIMIEMGPVAAAEKLVGMDEDFLTLAFSRQFLVVDTDALQSRGLNDLEEKVIESSLNQEFENYWVISRNPQSWDAVLAVLLAIDAEDHDFLQRLLERCCYLSSESIEDEGGLCAVLTEQERLDEDVADSRERRREREGYVAPQAAAAFLKLARGAMEVEDHLSPSYFKELDVEFASAPRAAVPADSGEHARFLRLLQEAEVMGPQGAAGRRYPLLRAALLRLREQGGPFARGRRSRQCSPRVTWLLSRDRAKGGSKPEACSSCFARGGAARPTKCPYPPPPHWWRLFAQGPGPAIRGSRSSSASWHRCWIGSSGRGRRGKPGRGSTSSNSSGTPGRLP